MLVYRILTSLILAVLLLGSIFIFPKYIVAVVIALLIGAGLWEFYRLVEKKGCAPFAPLGIAFGMILAAAAYLIAGSGYSQHTDKVISALVTCFLLFILAKYALKKDGTSVIINGAVTLLGILYVSYLFTYVIKVRYMFSFADGRMTVLSLFIIAKMSDIFAYFFGMKFGKHKLIPRISAGKSIEGSIAGVFGSVLMSVLLEKYIVPGGGWKYAVILGILMSVAGQIGDLVESLMKRDAEVKDSGKFVPGLGGVLDFMDSILYAAPVMYIYLSLL